MSLKRYRAKRDLSKTPEPSGGRSRGAVRHFVVQEHHASHLHYDFRLECDGVLKSWAVPKGPPRSSAERRLAIHVEDHPLAYRTFHGVIPKGNYGAGRVKIWDEGTFTLPSGVTSDAELRRGLVKGHVTVILEGKRLKGEYALVKLTRPGAKEGWLFLKARANKPLPSSAPRLLTGTRRAMPHLIHPMLAELSDTPFDREGWIFEMKWDGYRTMAEIARGKVKLYSRSQQSFNERFAEVAKDLTGLDDCVLDGEVVALNEKGKPDFQLLQEHHQTGKGHLVYEVFDLLYMKGRDLRGLPLVERKRLLKTFLPQRPHVRYTDQVERTGKAFLKHAISAGLEGIMAKNGQSTYQTGRRSPDWLKLKGHMRQEAVIVGYTEPRGTRTALGALILGVYRNGELTYIGHTGGGSDDHLLKELKTKLSKLERPTSAFADPPKPNAPVHWVTPRLVCEVKFQEWTRDGIMRQPILLGLRSDKSARAVVRERAVVQPGATTTHDAAHFSHADKVYWPKDGITKGDLFDYYRSISKVLLPYLKDRPFSLHRFPNGIDGEAFYQKDVPNAPKGIRIARITAEKEGKLMHTVVCDDLATLTYLVQLGCIEMNPWNSRVGQLDKPDYLVLDLDREDAPFSAVVQTARAVKQVLDEMKAVSVCKTSGASGLHVYVPLGAKYSYKQVRLFGQLIAELVHDRVPDLTSLDRAAKHRKGKVYVDYPQNRRGATTVAAYSVRPRPGAPVSTPLRWSEVKDGLDPLDFTIKTIPRRLKRVGDLWKPILGTGIDIAACLKQIGRSRSRK